MRIGVYDTPAAESGKSGAWRNAYLAIAMLKVDTSRRGEAAVKKNVDISRLREAQVN